MNTIKLDDFDTEVLLLALTALANSDGTHSEMERNAARRLRNLIRHEAVVSVHPYGKSEAVA